MEENKSYKAIIHFKNEEDMIIEGKLVVAGFNKNFYLLGVPSFENLQKIIYCSIFYVTKSVYQYCKDITPLKAIDKVLGYTESIMKLTMNTLNSENIELPQITTNINEVEADYAVGISDINSNGCGYPYDVIIEHFIKSVIYSCGLLLIVKYSMTIDDIFSIINEGIEAFKEEYVKEEDKGKNIIISAIGNGRKQEIEGKVAFVVADNVGGIVGDPHKYNLSDLGIGALSTIGSMYIDKGIEQDKIEKAIGEMYNTALDFIRNKIKQNENKI